MTVCAEALIIFTVLCNNMKKIFINVYFSIVYSDFMHIAQVPTQLGLDSIGPGWFIIECPYPDFIKLGPLVNWVIRCPLTSLFEIYNLSFCFWLKF